MCDTCGCGDTDLVSVEVQEDLLSANGRRAAHNREHFRAAGVTAVNLMGSPGAGKTAVLEATARRFSAGLKVGAVSGDLATDNDAARLNAAGIESRAITTGSACHLDAALVHRALHELPWSTYAYFFIENVGNLICPALYDLGQAANVVALSVTEGVDKPEKYPLIFRKADLVLLTKVDLLPYLPGVDVGAIGGHLARVMPSPRMIAVSAVTGEGIDEWLAWLESLRAEVRASAPAGVEIQRVLAHGHAHEHPHGHGHAHPQSTAGE
jgi:hydrogenase nickel incorporation protein HypB